MEKRTIALGLAAAVVTTMVAVPTFANGYGLGWGNGGQPSQRGEQGQRPERSQEDIEQRKQEMQEHRAAMEATLEAGDYVAWLEVVGDRPITEQVSEEEFPQFIEMHRLLTEGKSLMQQAKEIGEEIGLERPYSNRGQGFKHGLKQGFRSGRHFDTAQPTD